MNYRHAYHAGNFADVMKHLALSLIIDHLKQKDTPFCMIDAHGGIGLYDLSSIESQKTKEWEAGIGRFTDMSAADSDFALYWNAVKPCLDKGQYPGSPFLASSMLRPHDRLIANELHPEDVERLKDNIGCGGARITNLGAYECIRAHIPPKEKRGLILIDPPFEEKNEFETLSRQMGEWKKRFATGVYIIWYPIKAHLAIDRMKKDAEDLDLPRTWCLETLLHPRGRKDILNGCGLLIFNTPYLIPERLEALMPLLKNRMGLLETSAEWIVQD